MTKVKKLAESLPNWQTPQYIFNILSEEVGGYDLDLFADDDNALCSRYYTEADDAFKQPWLGKCFANPPYAHGFALQCISHALDQVHNGICARVDLLLKCDVSTRAFLLAFKETHIELFSGRIQFVDPSPTRGRKASEFGNMLVRIVKNDPRRGVVGIRSAKTGELL
jgi:phage N-6-adenine-methyltransferase